MSVERSPSLASKEEAELGFSKELTFSDEEFGGTEERKKLERKLLRKLDMRMSILIVIYILNYVRMRFPPPRLASVSPFSPHRSIAIMLGKYPSSTSQETPPCRASAH